MASTIGCDRVTKHMAAALLADKPPQSFLADSVRLEYAENAGGFLSLGAGLPLFGRLSSPS
jgi:signal peptidase II